MKLLKSDLLAPFPKGVNIFFIMLLLYLPIRSQLYTVGVSRNTKTSELVGQPFENRLLKDKGTLLFPPLERLLL